MQLTTWHTRPITREMAVGARKLSADRRRRRAAAVVDHVVVWMMSCVVRFVAVLLTASAGCVDRRASSLIAALPVDELPRRYLAAGVTGKLPCPLDEDPPNSMVAWTKDGRSLDAEPAWRRRNSEDGQPRVRYTRGGTLVFAAPSSVDEGVYTCFVYSPLRERPESPPMRVLVRGQ